MTHLNAIAIVVLSGIAGWGTFLLIKNYMEWILALDLRDET